MADLSPDHLEYRRICAEIDEFEQPGYRCDDAGDAALACLLDEAHAIADRVWAKPAETLGDVLLRGEIALRKTEASVNDGDDYDERACAELIRAAVKVLGGKSP